jgi:hypothetical protein
MLGKLLFTPDLGTTTSSFTQDLRVILAARFSPPRTAAFSYRVDLQGFRRLL